ncbi:MAG: hypothetical protein ABFR05_00900 [Bacteroidota bacterium]
MIFEKGYLYHIYNQGNNKQKIFYNRDNYLFFLKKINNYILPYGDILAWCLMPNHFHMMVLVKRIQLKETHLMTNNRYEDSHLMSGNERVKYKTLNNSIAILLRTYTRAINIQENKTGSLFKAHTKAECINCFRGTKPSFIQSNILINNLLPEKQYPQACFDYIHQNPVKANLVKKNIDWEFSSAKDYARLRNGKLINKNVAKEYVDF